MNKIIRVVALILALALAVGLPLGLVGCTETEYQPGEGGAPPETEKLQILSHSMSTTSYGSPFVQGTAKNVSSSRLSLASVDVKFYDAAGTLLSTSSDLIRDLDPGEIWSFRIIYFGSDEDKVANYKIGVGSTW